MNVNDKGFSQTLYNVFSFIQPANILCITSAKAYRNNKPSPRFSSRYLIYKFATISLPINRFSSYYKKILDWINYSINKYCRSFKYLQLQIKSFNADVIILAPNGAESVFMYSKLKSIFPEKKCFPYFMDDWIQGQQVKWAGGNVNDLVKKLLDENSSWLVISKNLADILSERFATNYSNLLELHNPVKIEKATALAVSHKGDNYTFAYAGSLWAMHFDALLIICKAINTLNKTKSITLIIYTTQEHWKWRKKDLEFFNVQYGGDIPYKEIHLRLIKADCLLVTSSFEKKWYTHTKGSVQTKLTDYMKAGRLIISCGPSYSANNQFIKKYDCGVCIETSNEHAATIKLKNILANMESNETYINNAMQALKENFTFEKVHAKLKAFLA